MAWVAVPMPSRHSEQPPGVDGARRFTVHARLLAAQPRCGAACDQRCSRCFQSCGKRPPLTAEEQEREDEKRQRRQAAAAEARQQREKDDAAEREACAERDGRLRSKIRKLCVMNLGPGNAWGDLP